MSGKTSSTIMDRIRKCLNLADRDKSKTTEAEAAAALGAAKKLMAEYNLSMSDVEIKEEARAGAVEAMDGLKRKDHPVWEQYMARVVDNLFGTDHYHTASMNEKGAWVRRVKFVGVGQDAAVAAESYTILVNMVWDMAYGWGYKGKEHTSYCTGVTLTLLKRAQDRVKDETPAEAEKCRGIMVIKNAVVKQHMTDIDLKPGRRRATSVNSEAFAHGKADGRNVNMDLRKSLR